MRKRQMFRIRVEYPATALTLIVWGQNVADALRRVRWIHKHAEGFKVLGTLAPADPDRGRAI